MTLNWSSGVEGILELLSLLSDITEFCNFFLKLCMVSLKEGWIFIPPPLLPTERVFWTFFILRFEHFPLILDWRLLTLAWLDQTALALPWHRICPQGDLQDNCHTPPSFSGINKSSHLFHTSLLPDIPLSSAAPIPLSICLLSAQATKWHTLFPVLGMGTHWKNPPCCNPGIAMFSFFFFFKLLVSQKNLWAVNSLQPLSSAVPNLL